jgi:hypothetical protein
MDRNPQEQGSPKVRQSLVLFGMVAGYGFGLATAFLIIATYGPLSPAMLMLAALFGVLVVFGAIAANEYTIKRR